MVKIFSIEEIVTASNSILNRDQKSKSIEDNNFKKITKKKDNIEDFVEPLILKDESFPKKESTDKNNVKDFKQIKKEKIIPKLTF